jgi:hypothetical protein
LPDQSIFRIQCAAYFHCEKDGRYIVIVFVERCGIKRVASRKLRLRQKIQDRLSRWAVVRLLVFRRAVLQIFQILDNDGDKPLDLRNQERLRKIFRCRKGERIDQSLEKIVSHIFSNLL